MSTVNDRVRRAVTGKEMRMSDKVDYRIFLAKAPAPNAINLIQIFRFITSSLTCGNSFDIVLRI